MSHTVETLRVYWCKGCEDFITDINHCEVCGNTFCSEEEPPEQPYSDIWVCSGCIDDENEEVIKERKKNGKI